MLRQKVIVFICFLALASSCSKEGTEEAFVVRALSSPEIEQELLGLVNSHRESLGYSPLQFSAVAYEFASDHNDYMIGVGDISHDNFASRASDISAMVSAEEVAENVAKNYISATQALEAWLASSGHRKTIEGNFTHTAVSVKKDAEGNYYYTQLFFR